MAIFKSFCAYRPSKANEVLIPALPYDVMNSEEAREMAKGNPLSFLHVDKAEIDFAPDVDHYAPEIYEKARENLISLEESGAMVHDEKPCLYIYRQVMHGRSQTGLVGCASIDDYINDVIKKHEHTLAKKEQDRIRMHSPIERRMSSSHWFRGCRTKRLPTICTSRQTRSSPIAATSPASCRYTHLPDSLSTPLSMGW